MYCIYIYIHSSQPADRHTSASLFNVSAYPPLSFFVALHGTGPGANSGHVTINHTDLRFNHQKLGLDHHGVLNDDLTSTRRIAATTMDML